MHELAVVEQLLGVVLDHTRKAKAERVIKIDLVIGELTGFVGDSLQFYFDILSDGTEAERASLSITRISAKARCHRCKEEFNPEGMNWLCPSCGGPIEEVMAGREFFVDSIEVD